MPPRSWSALPADDHINPQSIPPQRRKNPSCHGHKDCAIAPENPRRNRIMPFRSSRAGSRGRGREGPARRQRWMDTPPAIKVRRSILSCRHRMVSTRGNTRGGFGRAIRREYRYLHDVMVAVSTACPGLDPQHRDGPHWAKGTPVGKPDHWSMLPMPREGRCSSSPGLRRGASGVSPATQGVLGEAKPLLGGPDLGHECRGVAGRDRPESRLLAQADGERQFPAPPRGRAPGSSGW